MKKQFICGVKDGLPIGLGYLSVSFAFGVQASILGLPVILAVLTSMTNLTSAGQLAGIQIVAVLGSFFELIAVQLVINARYFLMSVSLSQKLGVDFNLLHRLICACGITDEIFAVAISKKEKLTPTYVYGLILLPYIGWTLGTLLGAIMGNVLPLQIQGALGIALYAMFIAIIIPPAMEQKGVLVAVFLSAGISCLFYYLPILKSVSQGISIIISALATAMICALIFPVKEQAQ